MQRAHNACLDVVSAYNINSMIYSTLWHIHANTVPLLHLYRDVSSVLFARERVTSKQRVRSPSMKEARHAS